MKIFNLINNLIMWYMQIQLEYLRKKQDTPYLFINGTGESYPKYLMYTDVEIIRNKIHLID